MNFYPLFLFIIILSLTSSYQRSTLNKLSFHLNTIESKFILDKTFNDLYESYFPPWLLDRCKDLGFMNPTFVIQCFLNAFSFSNR